MKTLRRNILALLCAIPILFGLLVPALAMPCADGNGAAGSMSCDVCLVGILPGVPVCAAACQAIPASGPAGTDSSGRESRAWFADLAMRPYGFDRPPDSPPPR